ncbi:hypothetical protein [Flavobacterium sp.]|uniref:hypothetical protein n=1 Tax=Flavobacterium sp. TaxID=239 RepID=UPI002D7FFD7E|nr:hypothetical protein [Flavobacterium sp.]
MNSKLFESLKLNESEAKSVVGGLTTSKGSDTAMTGGRYDVAFNTTDKGVIDTVYTSNGDGSLDQPV